MYLIVVSAFLVVAQHVVRLGDRSKQSVRLLLLRLGCALVLVGVVLERGVLVRLLELLHVEVLLQAENVVVAHRRVIGLRGVPGVHKQKRARANAAAELAHTRPSPVAPECVEEQQQMQEHKAHPRRG